MNEIKASFLSQLQPLVTDPCVQS